MKKYNQELIVGIFLIAGFLGFVYISLQLGELPFLSLRNHYHVSAVFNDVSGLKDGASVELAGVSIGRVQKIGLSNDRAELILQIHENVRISDDSIASIKTSGIIGDKYVRITPGGSENFLGPGDEIFETESALDLEELLGRYIFGDL
jgi:phospholipid/cholesterol/gamma-HCH transport system substrate-binding protein